MQAAEDRKQVEAEVAETDEQKIARLEREVRQARYWAEMAIDRFDQLNAYEASSLIATMETKVLNQREQLRNTSNSMWRRKQATRKMRIKLDAMVARAKEVDSEWYEANFGRSAAGIETGY